MADEVQNEVEVTKEGVKVKGRDVSLIILLLVAIGMGVLIYMLHGHTADARSAAEGFVGAVREQTQAIKEQTTELRLNNCLQIFKDPGNCQRIR